VAGVVLVVVRVSGEEKIRRDAGLVQASSMDWFICVLPLCPLWL